MGYFGKRYHPPGTPPGTLPEPAQGPAAPLSIRLIDYTDTTFADRTFASAAEAPADLERAAHTWIHVQGDAAPETLRELGRRFGLHPLALEDVINAGQRPKVERYDDHLFLVLAEPVQAEGRIALRQVSLFLGRDYVISFHPGGGDPFDPVRERLRAEGGRLRARGADYLLYALVDLVIDRAFPVLEGLGDVLEDLEDALLEDPDRAALRRLHHAKRDLLLLRRACWPQREAVNGLSREEHLLGDETRLYLRDCYDHAVHAMDLVESFRDVTAGLMDIYLSAMSNRMNEVMRVLTVMATLFIPLTFITGVYGMNFHNPDSPWAMPELGWYWGYPLALASMAVVAVGMVLYFKRKGWF
jgi:magnesium transporter